MAKTEGDGCAKWQLGDVVIGWKISDGCTSVRSYFWKLLSLAAGTVLLNSLVFVSWIKSLSAIIIKVVYEEFSNPVEMGSSKDLEKSKH